MWSLVLPLVLALGPGPGLEPRATEHFLLWTDADDGWTETTGAFLEATRARFYRVLEDAGFELEPAEEKLEWIRVRDGRQLADRALWEDGVEMYRPHGYYSVRSNRVVVHGADRESLAHEAAHQLAFNGGLQTRGVMYPLWVTEGLATWFEERGRRIELRHAVSDGRLLPIEDFLTLTRLPRARPDRNACYAQAWAVFDMLIDERPESLRRYFETLRAKPPGPRDRATMLREIATMLGPIEGIAASWRRRLAEADAGDARPATP